MLEFTIRIRGATGRAGMSGALWRLRGGPKAPLPSCPAPSPTCRIVLWTSPAGAPTAKSREGSRGRRAGGPQLPFSEGLVPLLFDPREAKTVLEQAPEGVWLSLGHLDAEFGLGGRLRRSREPDFLVQIVREKVCPPSVGPGYCGLLDKLQYSTYSTPPVWFRLPARRYVLHKLLLAGPAHLPRVLDALQYSRQSKATRAPCGVPGRLEIW